MEDGERDDRPERFPIQRRLRIAIAASVLLTAIGSFGFVGLLRMSALGVHKSVVLFAESTPWPDAPSPAALGVRTLESGRIASPDGSGWVELAGRRLVSRRQTPSNLIFELPPLAASGAEEGRVGVAAKGVESPPLPFFRKADAGGAMLPARVGLDGVGRVVRIAPDARDEVAAPVTEPSTGSCTDIVTLIPEGGVAQQFLETPLLARLTDASGRPRPGVSISLQRTPIGGRPSSEVAGVTDMLGITPLRTLLDAESAYALRWDCDEVSVTAAVQIPIRADGMLLTWTPAPVGADGKLDLSTTELRSRSVWQADLFCGRRWTSTAVAELRQGLGHLQFDWPATAAGHLCLAQASAQPYLGQPQHASTWILAATDERSLRAGVVSLFDTMSGAAVGPLRAQLTAASRAALLDANGPERGLALRWLLAWVPHRFESRPLLSDSAERDLAAMASHKAIWRNRFRFALALGALGLAVVWLPPSVARALADEAAATELALDESSPRSLTRSRAVIVRLVLFVVLALAALTAMVWVIS